MDFAGALFERQRGALMRLLLGGGLAEDGGRESPGKGRPGLGTALRAVPQNRGWGASGSAEGVFDEADALHWRGLGQGVPDGIQSGALAGLETGRGTAPWGGSAGRAAAVKRGTDGAGALNDEVERLHAVGRPFGGEWAAPSLPDMLGDAGAQFAPGDRGGLVEDYRALFGERLAGGGRVMWGYPVEDALIESRTPVDGSGVPVRAAGRRAGALETAADRGTDGAVPEGAVNPLGGGLGSSSARLTRGTARGAAGAASGGGGGSDGSFVTGGREGALPQMPVLGGGSLIAGNAQSLSRAFQRDARRYDGGFSLF